MPNKPEVNAPLFRDIRWGETVILDPMQWVIEQFVPGREENDYWAKCDTLTLAWRLAQPDCDLRKTKPVHTRSRKCYILYEVCMPLSNCCIYGTPGYAGLPFLDLTERRKDRTKPPVVAYPELAPAPVTLDIKAVPEEAPNTFSLAYSLCLPGNFVIYAKRPDYARINADHGIISPEELEDYYAGFERYSILVEFGKSK